MEHNPFGYQTDQTKTDTTEARQQDAASGAEDKTSTANVPPTHPPVFETPCKAEDAQNASAREVPKQETSAQEVTAQEGANQESSVQEKPIFSDRLEEYGTAAYAEPNPPRPLGKHRMQIGIPLLAVAFIFVLTTILANVIYRLAYDYTPALFAKSWFEMAVSSVSMYAIAMPLSYLIFRAVPKVEIKRSSLSLPVFLGLIGICFLMTYAGNYVGLTVNAIISAISRLFGGAATENPIQATAEQLSFWENLLFMAILAPIFEEIFFRKLLLDRIAPYGELPAILISGIGFGLIHGNFYQFFYAALVGMLFGYVYLKTGKLRYTVALHMIMNFIGGVFTSEMLKRLPEGFLELSTESLAIDPLEILRHIDGFLMMASYYLFFFGAIAGGIVALVRMRRHIRFQKGDVRLSGGEWRSVLLLNPATWIFAVVVIFRFVTSMM